jgi:hypothetical protein
MPAPASAIRRLSRTAPCTAHAITAAEPADQEI